MQLDNFLYTYVYTAIHVYLNKSLIEHRTQFYTPRKFFAYLSPYILRYPHKAFVQQLLYHVPDHNRLWRRTASKRRIFRQIDRPYMNIYMVLDNKHIETNETRLITNGTDDS